MSKHLRPGRREGGWGVGSIAQPPHKAIVMCEKHLVLSPPSFILQTFCSPTSTSASASILKTSFSRLIYIFSCSSLFFSVCSSLNFPYINILVYVRKKPLKCWQQTKPYVAKVSCIFINFFIYIFIFFFFSIFLYFFNSLILHFCFSIY